MLPRRVLETQLSAGASAGIALGIGLLCGLVAMLVRSVGLFLVGLLLRLLLAAATLLGSAPYYQRALSGAPWGCCWGAACSAPCSSALAPPAHHPGHRSDRCRAHRPAAADYFAELLLLARYAVEASRAAPVPLCWRAGPAGTVAPA